MEKTTEPEDWATPEAEEGHVIKELKDFPSRLVDHSDNHETSPSQALKQLQDLFG